MTVYSDTEISTQDGAPIECYKFIGSFTTYRYTSADLPVTLSGETYVPVPVLRDALRSGTQADGSEAMEITLPFDAQVVMDYAYSESPPRLQVEVYRVHRGTDFDADAVLLWKGKVSSFSVTGYLAKIKVPSVFAQALQGDLPSVYWQRPCNHVLFDVRCGLSRATYSTTTTVTAVGQAVFTVTDDGFADGYLVGGEAVNQRTGERRTIVSNTANVLQVKSPYVDNRVGDSIELTAGCDHSFSTCKSKFSNGVRYGGHPFIPNDNPFQGSIG